MSETPFVRDIKHSLDQGLTHIAPPTLAALRGTRHRAIGQSGTIQTRPGALALARQHPWSIALLLASGLLLALWWHQRVPAPAEDAEVDILLLTGAIPPQAYADWRLVSREDVGEQCVLVR